MSNAKILAWVLYKIYSDAIKEILRQHDLASIPIADEETPDIRLFLAKKLASLKMRLLIYNALNDFVFSDLRGFAGSLILTCYNLRSTGSYLQDWEGFHNWQGEEFQMLDCADIIARFHEVDLINCDTPTSLEICNGADDNCDGAIDNCTGVEDNIPCPPSARLRDYTLRRRYGEEGPGICATGIEVCIDGKFWRWEDQETKERFGIKCETDGDCLNKGYPKMSCVNGICDCKFSEDNYTNYIACLVRYNRTDLPYGFRLQVKPVIGPEDNLEECIDESGNNVCGDKYECKLNLSPDGYDSDCDRAVDEGCKCQPGISAIKECDPNLYLDYERPEPVDEECVGIGAFGLQFCAETKGVGNGFYWTYCKLASVDMQEYCDGIDNNCNGERDENPVSPIDGRPLEEIPCYTGCGVGVYECKDGFVQCSVDSAPEIPRNGLDDDCDGETDEVEDDTCSDQSSSGSEADGDADSTEVESEHRSSCKTPHPILDKDHDGFFAPTEQNKFVEWCCTFDKHYGIKCEEDFAERNDQGEITSGFAIYCAGANSRVEGNFYSIESQKKIFAVLAPSLIHEIDCDDENPNVNPQAVEQCNGIDDNCDGIIEQDRDRDGFYLPGECVATDGQYDCNDSCRDCHPGATEECDWIDRNCDSIPGIQERTDCYTEEIEYLRLPTVVLDRLEHVEGDCELDNGPVLIQLHTKIHISQDQHCLIGTTTLTVKENRRNYSTGQKEKTVHTCTGHKILEILDPAEQYFSDVTSGCDDWHDYYPGGLFMYLHCMGDTDGNDVCDEPMGPGSGSGCMVYFNQVRVKVQRRIGY